MKKALLIMISIFCFFSLLHGQQKTLMVSFEDEMLYDTLKCVASTERLKTSYLGVYQTKTNRWFFHIPDTVLEQSRNIQFIANQKNMKDIKFTHLAFRITMKKDTTFFTNAFPFWEKKDTLSIQARFETQDTIRNSAFYGIKNTVLNSSFSIIAPSPELQRSIVNNNDLYVKYRNTASNQFYDIFHGMISQAPDSHSNMLLLYDRRNWFPLEQLLTLRKLFSEQQQTNYFGRKLNEYIKILSDKFPDIQLTNCLTKQKEEIVVNDKKYTLLMFSASWCAPCHELIPLVKELYEKKKDVLDVVYITLDEPNRLPEWNQLVEKEKMPWRSLTVDGKIDEIRDKYKVRSIPYSYLIYPHKEKAEVVEVRKKEDVMKIEGLQLTE